jgi:hypothetical protein
LVNFKKIAFAGIAALSFGGVVASVSSADAQAVRSYGYQRGYDMQDRGFFPDVAGAAIGTAAAVGGVALDTGAFAGSPSYRGNGPGNFGYANWPYGYGYRGGSIDQGVFSPF